MNQSGNLVVVVVTGAYCRQLAQVISDKEEVTRCVASLLTLLQQSWSMLQGRVFSVKVVSVKEAHEVQQALEQARADAASIGFTQQKVYFAYVLNTWANYVSAQGEATAFQQQHPELPALSVHCFGDFFQKELIGRKEDPQPDAAAGVQRVMEAELNFQKAQVFLRRQDFEGAEEHLRRAVALNPAEGEHLATLAWAMFCNPKHERDPTLCQVRAMLIKACEVSPQCARAFFYLGQVLQALNMFEPALAAFHTALSLKPNYKEAKEAKDGLRAVTRQLN